MNADEMRLYLETRDKLIIASNGDRGFPHSVPMNFIYRDGCFLMTTFRKSQKVRNLERDSRVTILVESGEHYHELKSVMAYARAEIVDDFDATLSVLLDLGQGRAGSALDIETIARATAGKRVVLSCRPEQVISWDHSKLSGEY